MYKSCDQCIFFSLVVFVNPILEDPTTTTLGLKLHERERYLHTQTPHISANMRQQSPSQPSQKLLRDAAKKSSIIHPAGFFHGLAIWDKDEGAVFGRVRARGEASTPVTDIGAGKRELYQGLRSHAIIGTHSQRPE